MIDSHRAFKPFPDVGVLTCLICKALVPYEVVVNTETHRDVALLRLPAQRPNCPTEPAPTCPFLAYHVENEPNWP